MWATSALKAQTDAPNDSVQLQEVVVRGARVVNRTDGKMIFPSEEMTKSASSGYNLLKMLPLPNVKVDDINESITAANSLIGAVQVRINDVEASTADIQSLQPREVEKVEFIDRPGVRYGEGVGIVINIITRKVTSGYVIGASGTLVPKTDMVKGNAYTKLNSGKSELSLNYSGYYRHSNGMNTMEQADYLMADNTYNKVERNTNDIINRNTSHEIQARYSMINASGTAFLTTFSTSIDNNPRNYNKTDVSYSDGRNTTETIDNSEKTVTPLLDLYFKTNIGKNQSLRLNYTLTSSPASSKLQNMSGMSIITNEMEYSVGNPDLIMARRDDHTLTLSYQSPRLYTQLMTFYRHNDHPAMQHVNRTEDGRFAKTFLKGRRIDMLMLQSYTNYDIVPQHLNAYLSAEMLNIWNDGQDYSHRLTSFNFNVGLTAWLGNWTIMATMDNGFHFMENEYESRNIFSDYISVSYRLKNLTASLFCQNLFKSNGKIEEVENHNYLAHKLLVARNRDTSNAIGIKLVWTLSKGRNFKGIDRDTDSLKDKETGVAKSG